MFQCCWRKQSNPSWCAPVDSTSMPPSVVADIDVILAGHADDGSRRLIVIRPRSSMPVPCSPAIPGLKSIKGRFR